jgi:hypothetical protein
MRCVLGLILFVAACSSHPPRGTDPGSGSAGHAPDAAIATAPTPDGGPAALTHDECDQLIDQILRVQFVAMNKSRPANKQLTEDDIPVAREKLSTEMMAQCLAWDRPSYECIMAAKDLEAIQTCVGS